VSNLLRQLQNNDAVLLLYLAGELPPEDRTEVEQMLATDPLMRGALERLRDASDAFESAMPGLDRATRLPAPEPVAMRRVMRAMRQWQARRLAAPGPAESRRKIRFPLWAYPLAAAASVVIAFLVWWGNTERPGRPDAYAMTGKAAPVAVVAPSPQSDVAQAWAMGGPADVSDEVTSLIEPSDYNLFFPIADSELGATPGVSQPPSGQPEPPLSVPDPDDILL
jgi:anti-sigma factor RsiW